MDSRHDFTLEKVFWGYFGALDQKANSALVPVAPQSATERPLSRAATACAPPQRRPVGGATDWAPTTTATATSRPSEDTR